MTGFDSKRQMAQAKLYTTSPAAQPEQEPVAWISHNAGLYHFKPDESLDPLPLYLAPPAAQRPWVGLTDAELQFYIKKHSKLVNAGYDKATDTNLVAKTFDSTGFYKEVSTVLRERNT